MNRCRTCRAALIEVDAPTCGAVVCVRVDLAATAVCEQWRKDEDRSVWRSFVEFLRGEVQT